ncbi:AzlD domain-containing protein [Neisseriaceae bacterium ESL0693]|nr:AzlD domain-containing protein [Neisseriaceae bacterium ESL0693]
MMEQRHLLLVILLCSGISFILRAAPLMLLANRRFPPLVKNWLSFIPSTIITALIMSEIASHLHQKTEIWCMLIATLVSFMACYFSRSLFLTVVVGMAVYLCSGYLL